ncbi:MAG: 4-oxalocrotonate tautomerase DmpI [Bacillota bacterium]
MPIIEFDGPVLNKEKKGELAAKLTRAAKEVLPEFQDNSFIVVIKENSADNVAVGGKLISDK